MHRPTPSRLPATAAALLGLLWMFVAAVTADAFPTWIGVYGDEVRHTDNQNPGTYTILLNEDYFGLNASVGIQVNGGAWEEIPMAYAGKTNQDSRWRYTPDAAYPAGAVVRYYFHGWDGSGHIYDNNGGADYAFTAAVVSVFAPLVQGVSQVVAPGLPGPLFAEAEPWVPIVGGDEDSSWPSACVYARTNGLGRVVVFGADGIFGAGELLDNARFLQNVVAWLDGAGSKAVRYTTGHGEWIQTFNDLALRMASNGYVFTALPDTISASQLATSSVLIVGNAWQAFTSNEVDAVRQFVENGGGLCLLGLGWSWEPYHPGSTIEQYPMMALAAPFGIRWLRAGFSDPTDLFNGWPRFHTFYPDVPACTITGAMDALLQLHAQHTTNLPAVIQTNTAEGLAFTRAHQTLMVPASEMPSNHAARPVVASFCSGLLSQHASFYGRMAVYPAETRSVAAWTRERYWRTWRDIQPLTPQRVAEVNALGGVAGPRLDLLENWGVVLLDNNGVQPRELDVLVEYFSVVPSALHNLRSLSVVDYLGSRPAAVTLDGLPGAVNVFGIPIEGWWENSFPDDIAPATIATFSAVLAHEVNHVVDAHGIRNDPVRDARRLQLIAAAGGSASNYLRSMFADGFFSGAPQEFVASIANQWFTDSAHTLRLGVQRFAQGGRHPVNQALFFADLYSEGARTWFYRIDTNAVLWRHPVALERDGQGRIVALHNQGTSHRFTLDGAGDVTGIVSSPYADTDADGIPDWWTQQYFGHPTGQVDDLSRADDDASGTGQPNRFKYAAGLDPTNAARFVWEVDVTGAQATVRLGPVVGGHTYGLERATHLTTAFQPVAIRTQRIDAALLQLDDPAPGGGEGYYRLRVARP